MTNRLKELHHVRDIELQLAEAQLKLRKFDVDNLTNEAYDYAVKMISEARR